MIHENYFATVTRFLHARGLRHRAQARGRGLDRDFFEVFAETDVPEVEEEVHLPEAVWTAHLFRLVLLDDVTTPDEAQRILGVVEG